MIKLSKYEEIKNDITHIIAYGVLICSIETSWESIETRGFEGIYFSHHSLDFFIGRDNNEFAILEL